MKRKRGGVAEIVRELCQSRGMEKFGRSLEWLALIMAWVMTVLGWNTARLVGFEPGVVMICALATLALVIAMVGFARDHWMVLASGMLGCAILFPTPYGAVPMVIGAVLFFAIVSLHVYRSVFENPRR